MPSSLLSMGTYDDVMVSPPEPNCDAYCPDGTKYNGCMEYFADPCLGHYKPIIDPPAPDCTGYCKDGTAYDTCAFYVVDPCRGHYVDPKLGGADGLVHTLPFIRGSRQFTVTLSDDEVADLCNCPTEPTQPPLPNNRCDAHCPDGTKYNSCMQSFSDPCLGHQQPPNNQNNCDKVDCRTAWNSPCCVIVDPQPEQAPNLDWLEGFRQDLWQYWFDMGAETCRQKVGIAITRGQAFAEIAKRWDYYGNVNRIQRLPSTINSGDPKTYYINSANKRLKELLDKNTTTESLGKVERSGVIRGLISAGCNPDQDSIKFAMSYTWKLEPVGIVQG